MKFTYNSKVGGMTPQKELSHVYFIVAFDNAGNPCVVKPTNKNTMFENKRELGRTYPVVKVYKSARSFSDYEKKAEENRIMSVENIGTRYGMVLRNYVYTT